MNKNNLWDNERITASIKLGAWLIFIVVIIVIFSVTNKNNNQNESQEKVYNFRLYEDMQNDLLNKDYNYSFKIKVAKKDYNYNGIKCGVNNLGYKETKNEIIKYLITDNEIFKINLEEYIPINTIYEEVNPTFVNVNALFENLKNSEYSVEKEEDKRTIKYKDQKSDIKVVTDLENIRNITIINGNDVYNLEFTTANKCDSIGLN